MSSRWPALVLVPALLVGGFIVDRQSRPDAVPAGVEGAGGVAAMPVIEAGSSSSATWFCAAGAPVDASGDVVGSMRLRVVNTTDEDRSGTVTAHVAQGVGGLTPEPFTDDVMVEANGSRTVDMATLVGDWPFVGVAVEFDGGGVLVEQLVDGPTGSDAQPCATRGAAQWYLPIGSTLLGASYQLLLFNPFPEDAVVDVIGATENGVQELDAVVVQGQSIVAIALGTEDFTVSDEVAVAVRSRVGRIVTAMVQTFDPDDSQNALGTRGLAAIMGTPATSEIAYLPHVDVSDRIVVYNPSPTEQAEVDVLIVTDEANQPIEPFELTVFPNQQQTLDLVDEERLVGVERFTVIVQSYNSVPVVVGRRSLVIAEVVDEEAPVDPDAPEVAAELSLLVAAPEAARRLVLDVATGQLDPDASRVTLVNPSFDTISTVVLSAVHVDGTRDDPVEVELEPGGRQDLSFGELGVSGEVTLYLDASAPIVAQRELISTLGTRSSALAVPVIQVFALEPVGFDG